MEQKTDKPDEREKRSTDHPVTYTVPTGIPPDKGADVGLRTGLIGIISAGIALIVQRTLYPELLKRQPVKMPVKMPPVMGFFAAGFGTTTAIVAARPKEKIRRRHFFYSFAAGVGAGIGYMMGAELENTDAPDPDVPDETPVEDGEESGRTDFFDNGKCEDPVNRVEDDPGL